MDVTDFEAAADRIENRLNELLEKAREIQACAPVLKDEVSGVLDAIEQSVRLKSA